MTGLLHTDRLFQTLLVDDLPAGFIVAADLDVDSIDEIPFITHSSDSSQAGNADGVWDVTLSVNVFTESRVAFENASVLYSVVKRWGDMPSAGIVPGVGGIENVEDQAALNRVGGSVQMLNKWATHYSGTFLLTVKSI